MQNTTIPVIPAQAGTQFPPDPDPSFAKIINPAYLVNPVNLDKILTVKNSANPCQKFCISLAPQVVRPPFAENFPLSLFVKNLPKYSKIFKNRCQKLTEIVRN